MMCCRVAQVALVSKSWRGVEKRNAHQPLELQLQPTEIEHSFLNWNLRDTSRLEVVGMPFHCTSTAEVLSSRSYWKCVRQLLVHLTTEAPALWSLKLILYKDSRLAHGTDHNEPVQHGPPFRFLPLIGLMTQLRSLALCSWEIVPEDIPLISQLTNLQILEVTSTSWASACFTLPQSGRASVNHEHAHGIPE
jgi:hypothetical protein